MVSGTSDDMVSGTSDELKGLVKEAAAAARAGMQPAAPANPTSA